MTQSKHLLWNSAAACILAGTAAALAAPAYAAHPAQDEPATIRSRDVELNQKTGTAVYRGKVVYVQGDLSLYAERVDVFTQQRKADIVTATGRPVIARQRPADNGVPTTIEADRLDYHINQRTLDLRDRVVMHQGEDSVRAATAHYDLVTGRLDARGDPARGERVEAVIHRRQEAPAP
jgi:lipopolysaccharide export system protein LptA